MMLWSVRACVCVCVRACVRACVLHALIIFECSLLLSRPLQPRRGSAELNASQASALQDVQAMAELKKENRTLKSMLKKLHLAYKKKAAGGGQDDSARLRKVRHRGREGGGTERQRDRETKRQKD